MCQCCVYVVRFGLRGQSRWLILWWVAEPHLQVGLLSGHSWWEVILWVVEPHLHGLMPVSLLGVAGCIAWKVVLWEPGCIFWKVGVRSLGTKGVGFWKVGLVECDVMFLNRERHALLIVCIIVFLRGGVSFLVTSWSVVQKWDDLGVLVGRLEGCKWFVTTLKPYCDDGGDLYPGTVTAVVLVVLAVFGDDGSDFCGTVTPVVSVVLAVFGEQGNDFCGTWVEPCLEDDWVGALAGTRTHEDKSRVSSSLHSLAGFRPGSWASSNFIAR